jgi:hypothetical protein
VTSIDELKRRQTEMTEIISALRGLLKSEHLRVAPIARVAHSLLCDLRVMLREHLEEEEQRLHPNVLSRSLQGLKNLARCSLAGDVRLREQFDAYARRWLKDCDLVVEDAFIVETMEILDTLARRVDRERTIMMPWLEASGVFARGGAPIESEAA